MRINWQHMRHILPAVIIAVSITCLYVLPAGATVFKFELDWGGQGAAPGSYSPAGNGFWIPDEYGDRVNGLDQNNVPSDDFGAAPAPPNWYNFYYGNNGEGFTPNVVVGYSGAGFRHWPTGYGNLSHAAYFSTNGFITPEHPIYTHYETFTPDAGFDVKLHSLQLDRYTGADASTITVNVYAGSDPQNLGAQLFTSGLLTVSPGGTQTITPNVTSHGLTLAYVFEDQSTFFSIDYWATDNIIISQSAVGLPGDFNNDGAVNAGDYVTWKKNAGTSNTLPNDNQLGTPIGAAHYNLWRANFGTPPGAGGGAGLDGSVVPEPASLLLMAAAIAGLLAVRQR